MHRLAPLQARFGRAVFSALVRGGILFVLALACACAKSPVATREEAPRWRPAGPAVAAAESQAEFVHWLDPRNQDLTSWRELAPTVRKSLRYVKNKPQNAVAVNRPGLRLTWGDMRRTLERLDELLPRLDAEPGLFLANFTWVPVTGGIDYSGYYEPYVRASRTAKPGYPQAIYALPPDLARVKRRNRGRYHDRRTIEEKQVLAGKGLELAWAADPVDVFFLEIQGSGRLIFDDGTQAFVNYAGQNGHKYKSSGRIMREKGLLKEGHIFEQREWFKNNPDRVREILNENPSYVFFRYGNRGPTGAMGHVVDDWLSLATDRKYIPLGAVVAYGVNAPDPDFGTIPLRGIGFAQDVGGAIKRNRIDIFCGGGERANYVASHLDAHGPAWVLVAR
ncbi:MltA domain-containing protein [uncultured Desulfovibrio sp.]|uniref:MltA domain-containing protein n=1 Tax=uncultured Desulfovibrio sp. TaxID=167968 RepID=UPI002630C868|nr:MltA domain-containing protein [uncultured Desulfovibrio sp.]